MMSDGNSKSTQAQRLAQLRRQKGFTAEQLAQAMTAAGAKVSRGAISNWERGTNGIVSSKLPTLARILGCSEGYLLRGDLKDEASDIGSAASIDHSGHQDRESPIDSLSNSQIKTQAAEAMTLDSTNNNSHTNSISDHAMNTIKKSDKLQNVCYDIRGPLLQTANKMEAEGKRILKLNVGNPAPFGLAAPHEILRDVSMNLSEATGYSDSQGIFSARKAILQYYQSKGLLSAVDVRDVYLGNGVSELIVMTMQALMNDGDEVLIPMLDYPLWTAAANLAGGTAVHYRCNEADNWHPDIEDIKSKITSKTKGIVVINPNNPTGALYSDELLKQIIEVAKEYNLIIMADEIYDRILYDDNVHTPMSTLTDEVLVLSYNGLSKSHRIAGFRSGWMIRLYSLATSMICLSSSSL